MRRAFSLARNPIVNSQRRNISYVAPLKDINFVLFDVLKVDEGNLPALRSW
jgi:hypothetical protein